MAEIQLINVCKTYGRGKKAATAVHDLDYTIEDGHFVSLLGPSGCGKSTTLNMIAGLEDITDGEILIDGARVDDLDPDKRDLAFVFQDYALYPHMDVFDNIGFGLKMRKIPKAELEVRVQDAARRLDIEGVLTNKPRTLSGGQRQRVALARAIARRPAVFLFDEPLSNLDALLRDQTRSELKMLHAELGATSVYVTHDQEEAMSLSDRIVVMSRGRLEQYGTPYEIYNRPATRFVASFVGKPRMNLLAARRVRQDSFEVVGSRLLVEAPGVNAAELVIGLRPEQVRLRPGEADLSHGTVKVIEPLGNVADIIIDLGSALFTVRIPGFGDLSVGSPVIIDTVGAPVHCFEPETGQRIDPQS